MNWNASNYRERKAQRLAQVKPQWVVNPETGEEFYLRKVGSLMSSVLAGYMPSGLTKVAIEAWKEKGVEGLGADNLTEFASKLTPEQIETGEREMVSLSRIVQQSCVIPFLSNLSPEEIEFTNEWRESAIAGLREKDPAFDVEKFDPKELVFPPGELEDKDTQFLIKWAQGIAGTVSLKGGKVMDMNDLERFRKKPGRRVRAKSDKQDLQQTA